MDLLLGAGPQITLIDTQSAVCSDPTIQPILCTLFGDTLNPITVKNTKLGVAAQARLRYKFPTTTMALSYQRFETSGSGLFAGAQSDIVRLSATRRLSRVWTGMADIGYSRNERVQPLSADQLSGCTTASSQDVCPANDAQVYSYGFVGGSLHFEPECRNVWIGLDTPADPD
jgi:hypothetical protein